MITAVIVLSVVALALGGYIAFDVLHDNRSIKNTSESAATEPLAVRGDAPRAVEPTVDATEDIEERPEPEQTVQTPVDDKFKPSEAPDEVQAEKKPRRRRYKDPDLIFTEEVERSKSKLAQTPITAPTEVKKKPTKPTTAKKPTADKKAEQQAEPKAAEPQAAEPPAPMAQSHAKEEKNKIALNISSPEAVAQSQRGDKAAEAKLPVEIKTLPPDEVRAEVAATEVDKIMTDEVAESLVELSETASDRTKQGIINIDVLSQHFDGGEVVTLAEIKKRIKGFNKKTTYLKVLARGTLDKPLTVEADSFSLQAVKMIVLTGGKAMKKRN